MIDDNEHIMNRVNAANWLTSTDPAWMLGALGDAADDRRGMVWANECSQIFRERTGFQLRDERLNDWREWIEYFSPRFRTPMAVTPNEACLIIRCLWPSPFIERERVECDCDNGRKRYTVIDLDCSKCNGKGYTLAPLINPRWRTPLVLDLARQVRGKCDAAITCGGQGTEDIPPTYSNPNPELMPILADAIEEAGCDVPEIGEHLRCGVHGPECWAVEVIINRG